MENGKRDFIIATTKFINGNTLIQSLIEPVGVARPPPPPAATQA
jgi:hypothetical protein